ncbi:serine hydrolase domain-containing protein [Microbacterium rhizomatis]|uniref:Beta-lactamase family protein n=1 Tax=Microbacterium rhizomatis TaxID=1631477 RepID=A0A5J5J2M5_9MICO|nr:serine hydrolase domain-containing protein [Microbacterium rhizomatis]KAA9110457.1 beta-lactamase family protein [Microbacterium rhizomatis]
MPVSVTRARASLRALAVTVAAFAVLTSTGCTIVGTHPPSSPTPAASPSDQTRIGVIAGSDPRAAEITGIVEAAIPELALQSVVFGVWVGDDEIVRGAVDSPSAPLPTATDALVRVGQPMEAMLGTILLQLGTEGVVDLDAPVSPYVPELVNADRITPRMLANTTGGTPDYVTNADFIARVHADPFAHYTFSELLGYAQQSPPLFAPGTGWAYSHTEMAALVQVLERASGQSLEDLMQSRIYGPLGMTRSSAHQDSEIGQPAMHAYTNQRGVYEDSTSWDPTWGFDGGMNAPVIDLGRWLRALNDGDLLTAADAETSLAPVSAGLGGMSAQRYFAYGSLVADGWIVGNPILNGYQGFTAQERNPSVTIVVWSAVAPANTETSNASQTIAQRIAAIVSATPFTM